MRKKIFVSLLGVVVLATIYPAQAQQAKVYRVGVVFDGGAFYAVVHGLKDGRETP
jgi:hypothetical protein